MAVILLELLTTRRQLEREGGIELRLVCLFVCSLHVLGGAVLGLSIFRKHRPTWLSHGSLSMEAAAHSVGWLTLSADMRVELSSLCRQSAR